MKVVCPTCHGVVAAADIDLLHGRALCRSCSEVIPLPDFGAGTEDGALVGPASVGGALGRTGFRPEALRFQEQSIGRRYTAQLAQNRLMALPILGFAAVWDGFLVVWYGIAFGVGHGGPAGLMLWFPLLHVAAGLAITWAGLRLLLNTSRVSIDPERFRVGEGPLPGRRVDEETANVVDVDVLESDGVERRYQARRRSYTIRLLTRDGRSVHLPLPTQSREQAEYVCGRLRAGLEEARAPKGYRA